MPMNNELKKPLYIYTIFLIIGLFLGGPVGLFLGAFLAWLISNKANKNIKYVDNVKIKSDRFSEADEDKVEHAEERAEEKGEDKINIDPWSGEVIKPSERKLSNNYDFKSTKGLDEGLDEELDEIPPFPTNFDWYLSYTQQKDWESICHLNGIRFDKFGTKKEINFLSDYLEEGEVVFALASGVMSQTETSNSFEFGVNTWLVVLTNERFLFMDAAMLTNSVDTQSIRLNRVQAVSASQGLVLGKIMIDLGSRVVTVDNCIKESVKVVADLANK